MLAEFFPWLKAQPTWMVYSILAIVSSLEYIVPPLPGDLITLFGVFLVAQAGLHWAPTFVALWVGAMFGGWIAYLLGLRLARVSNTDYPSWLRGERVDRSLAKVVGLMQRRSAWLLAVNRFFPGLRALFFVAAGVARVPVWRVIVFGGASAAAWNAILFAIGYSGAHWEDVTVLLKRFQWVAAAAGVLLALGVWLMMRLRRSTTNAFSEPD